MTKNMGLGVLGERGLSFVRKFRYTLSGNHLSEWFNKESWIDYKKKIISLVAYEAIKDRKIEIHDWADAMEKGEYPDETLVLTTYNGCGKELYKKRFSELKIEGRKSDFDYSSSDVACTILEISYKECVNEAVTDHVHATEPKETSVDHLNARMFVQ